MNANYVFEPKTQPTSDQIAAMAYQLYCERGQEDGHALEDWLEAERRLSAGESGGSPVPKAEVLPSQRTRKPARADQSDL